MWPKVERSSRGVALACFVYEPLHVGVHRFFVINRNIGVANSKKAIARPRRLAVNKYAVTSPAINEGDLLVSATYRTPRDALFTTTVRKCDVK